MQQVRELCKCLKICFSGRVTKQDLYLLVCDHFNISTSGGTGDCPSSEKPRMPPHVSQAYKKLPSFGHITAGWSVANLCKIPFFDISSVKEYLLDSPDKAYDGGSLRCYKQLRAYQLFDERHIHDLEANLWNKGEHFFFVRAKCWPSQDTSRAAYKCVVCIDREEGRCFGAHCRCVSGLGEACSHVAGLLFALEDFSSRGMQMLTGPAPAVTETICKWCKPCTQKINAVPLESLTIAKAAGTGRKRKQWTIEGINRYDPRHKLDRKIDPVALSVLETDLFHSIGDCGFLRLLYDLKTPDPSGMHDIALEAEVSFRL